MTSPDDPGSATVEAVWEDLLADLGATADQYREDGWDTLELHPGDVTVRSGEYDDRFGLDVLVPDDEYRVLDSWFDDGLTVDGYDVYRSTADPVVLLIVVVRDESARRAVLYPLVYSTADDRATALFETATDRGTLGTYLRRLSGDYIELRHEDPELLAPPSDDRPEDS